MWGFRKGYALKKIQPLKIQNGWLSAIINTNGNKIWQAVVVNWTIILKQVVVILEF